MRIEKVTDAGVTQTYRADDEKHNKNRGSVGEKLETIYAGNLNMCNDKIQAEKEKAKAMAMQLISNAFANEQKIDEDIEARNKRAEELKTENKEYTGILNDIEKERENLKEIYGIQEDSSEEADLELLRKERASLHNPQIKLSDEEKAKLETIYENGITEYQNKMLELDESASEYEKKIEENEKSIIEEYAIIRGIQIERLKSQEMADAKKQGKQILNAASDKIKGLLIEDAKETVDETQKEQEETIEKQQEKLEELEEKIEAMRAKRKENEEELEVLYEIDSAMEKVKINEQDSTLPDMKKSLEQMINELKLTAEDLKGMVVDSNQ